MKYLLFAGLIALLYTSCKPSMEMRLRPYDQEKEMPRFCFTERMFFYEISKKENDLQLWIYSNNRLTIDQLISQPLRIYFAEKTKRNIKYQLKYKDLVNNALKNKNEIQLKFYKYEEKDTIDLTAKYKFNVSTEYNGSQYNLKIEFPESIIKDFEEPVVGIKTDTPEPFKKQKDEVQNPQGEQQQTPEEAQMEAEHRQNQGQRQGPTQPHGYVKKIEDIKLWFSLIY
ncbi:MAG: hypothetical protein C0599_18140 [Salinivirgaceae bacterium]|nr:MAG: hypothetical protein C0599_18140 [Salinivirgaceae bacterium]